MPTMRTRAGMAVLLAVTAACQSADERPSKAAETSAAEPAASVAASPTTRPPIAAKPSEGRFAAITPDETIRLVGTEPFWGGTVSAGVLMYSTPEDQAGEAIAVRRFAGNNGLGFSGIRNRSALDLTITPGKCSDGMSDRTYPFAATLKLGDEQRNGCAWTDRTRFTGSENP